MSSSCVCHDGDASYALVSLLTRLVLQTVPKAYEGRQLLRILYQYRQAGDFSRSFVCGTSYRDTRISEGLAWIPMKRQQWFPFSSTSDELDSLIQSELSRSHTSAVEIRIDSVTVLRQGSRFLSC